MSFAKKQLDKKGKNPIPGPFIWILYDEMDSVAFKALPGNAAKALTYFRRIDGRLKKKYGDDYNGVFDFTYSEARKFGFAKSTFSRIITELSSKGFIDIVKQGGKRGCGMSNSRYRLSERWREFGTKVFMERVRFPSEPPT